MSPDVLKEGLGDDEILGLPGRASTSNLTTEEDALSNPNPTRSDVVATSLNHDSGDIVAASSSSAGLPECFNCGTTHTPLWRPLNGVRYCNARGLYRKLVRWPFNISDLASRLRSTARPRSTKTNGCRFY